MNKIYRVVWNQARQCFIAAHENVRAGGKTTVNRSTGAVAATPSTGFSAPLKLTAVAALLAFPGSVLAADLPTGGQIIAGSGSISQSGTTMTVTQDGAKMAANWQSFSIGKGHTVNFVQPSASAIAFNRVIGSDVSVIQGALNANGQVFLVNPNGVLFTPSAQVNVGSLIASTFNMSTEDFLAGNYKFEGDSSGAVINQGSITAANGGTVALIAAKVENTGSIVADQGNVLLGVGSKVTLDLGGPVKLQVEQGAIDALIENGGAIRANGGTVLLTAKAAQDLASTVINNDGIIEAQTLATGEHGEVVLLGEQGTVQVAGTIDVSAEHGEGGKAIVTGERVLIADGAHIDATGTQGGGEIYIGGGWQGKDPAIKQAMATVVAQGATLDASATDNGDGGTVVAWSDVQSANSATRAYGTFLARGGVNGGNGGRIETSGHWLGTAGAKGDAAAQQGHGGIWLFDPYNVIIASSSANGGFSSGNWLPSGDSSTILNTDINSMLNSGTNVMITTGNAGEQIGDITVNAAVTKSAGNSDVSLTLQAANSIVVNENIENTGGSGKLNVLLDADNDNGVRDGGGIVVLNADINTGGGNIAFGTGATANINGVVTKVGGDVYVGGDAAQSLNTGGGSVTVNGEMILANTDGLTINTAGGDVRFLGLLNSGNRYDYVDGPDGQADSWDWARNDAKNGTDGGAALNDSYLVTITSRLENSVAVAEADYRGAWIGAYRPDLATGTWVWSDGPEGGQHFFTENAGAGGGAVTSGYYANFGTGEPNGYSAGSAENRGQFFGTGGQWNDLAPATAINGTQDSQYAVLGYVRETNAAASPLTIDAGAGRVTFGDRVGSSKALASLDVTAGAIVIDGEMVKTEGAQTYNGDVEFGSLQQFTNPSFEDGMTGWAITDSQVYFNGGSNIGGFVTPTDTTYPNHVAGDCNTATGANCDNATFTGTFTTNISNDVAVGAGTQSLVMNSNGNCSAGFCIVRGPYVVSDSTVTLPEGGMVSFKWQAKGGSDAYDVYGYLLNTSTGAAQPILNSTGSSASATQTWTTAAVSVEQAGTYKFVFVSGSWDATGGQALGAQLFIDDIKAAGGAKGIDAAQVTFNGTIFAADNQLTVQADKIDFNDQVSGTGKLTLQQRTASQEIEIGGNVNANAGTLDITAAELAQLQDGFSSITIGSEMATGSTAAVGASTFNDNVTLRSGEGGIALNDSVTASDGNRVTLKTTGVATQTVAGIITAGGGLELLGAGGNYQLDAADNDVDTLSANTGSVEFKHGGALSVGSVGSTEGITATGKVNIATDTGNLTIAKTVSTNDTSADAVVLNAGKDAAVGNTSGGNVVISDGSTVTTGEGGRATIYTGSVTGSTGVTNLVGSGSGRFRYNSDEATTNYTKALASGSHAIYREAPTATVTTNSHTKVYDGQAYDGAAGVSVTGLYNGDTLAGPATYTSVKDAGSYTLRAGDIESDVGYAFDYVDGTLTITPRDVNVTAVGASKTYGDADVLAYTAEAQSGSRGLVTGDTLGGALSRASGEDVGTYAINLGTVANGNYSINYTGANLTIAKRAITLAADVIGKVYGETDPTLTISIIGGDLGSQTVNDTLADVTGALSRELGNNVGTYDVALGAGDKASNYDITFNTNNNALTITPRPIIVRANDQQKIQGGQDPALTYTAEAQSAGRGLLNGESLVGALARASGDGIGDYVIGQNTLTDANNSNYAITFINGKFTVRPATEVNTAQMAAQSMVGNSAQNFAPFSTAGLPDNENASGDSLANSAGQSPDLRLVDINSFDALNSSGNDGANSNTDEGNDAATPGADENFSLASRSNIGPLTVFVVEGGIKLPEFQMEQAEQ